MNYMEICVAYEDRKKLIVFNQQMSFSEFQEQLKKEFNFSCKEIKLVEILRNAEISSMLSLKEDREIRVIPVGGQEHDNIQEIQSSKESQIQVISDSIIQINYDELKDLSFENKGLLEKLNQWAQKLKFKLICLEGIKKMKIGYKRTFGCNKKGCNYKIILKSEENGQQFRICEKLSNKHNKHNHCLNYEGKAVFNNEIDNELHFLQGRVRSYNTLTEMLNEKFYANFQAPQVKYRVSKLFGERLGHAESDAYDFVKLAQEDIELNGGFFEFELDNDNKFKRTLYCSKVMQLYSEYFLDRVIIDSTYRRNRFNLIVVDIISINNQGRNILLGFGLLSDETIESYVWLLLKIAWKNKGPQTFISDESEAIQKEKKFETKTMWAKCFVKLEFSGGVSTTSRIEGLHAIQRKYLTASSNLKAVFKSFRLIEKKQIENFNEEFLRHNKRNEGDDGIDSLKFIKENYSEYVYKRIVPKFMKAINSAKQTFGRNIW